KRRAEILELFRTHVFGHAPKIPALRTKLVSADKQALGGKATRKLYRLSTADGKWGMDLLVYLPNQFPRPVPVFLGMNFQGNHTVSTDPGIPIREQWVWDNKLKQERLERPGEETRGSQASRWPIEMILAGGYGVATFPRHDVEPDYAEGWRHGIRALYPGDWGCIGAWAWALSRALDCLEKDPDVDARRVIVHGHSRLGKTALWAGAQDERFAIVISNNSGEGGAAITRRCFGETIARINTAFPHWFCANFKKYNDRENDLPVDAHMLVALSAPRPVYVASASEDLWADPKGEFLACVHADPVYRLLGTDGFGVAEMPPVNTPVGRTIGYHCREGKHDITEYDWRQYIMFADRHFQRAYAVYFGTYTRTGKSKGIYRSLFNAVTGALGRPELVAETTNPSFLAIHPNRRLLYAVGELADKKGGAVCAFAIEPSGKLTLLNQQSSVGAGPCHVNVDKTGKNVLVANYAGGSVAVLPIQSDGCLREASCFIQHVGSSVNPKRQQGPHAHSIFLDAANRFAFAPDLGLDKIMIYRFDADKGVLTPNDPAFATVAPGSGPRHFAFHPNGRFAYVINELSCTITAFRYDTKRGTLTEIQTVSTLPQGETVQPNYSTAEVVVHPNGKFLYGSNRGHDTIAVFAIDRRSGKLTPIQHAPVLGQIPRNFNLDPTGRWLLAAHQNSDSVVVFRVDTDTGKLTPTDQRIELGAPVCVKFVPLK
ncbi:MAG: beta-propeller fold lactonase family protein, partial [Verrucomicrobiae bacterium]|nr:beta-propeller fold lactonase family protein [Verrucomicrobiae bacterium]